MSVLELTLENFEAEVLQSDKPVLIDFWATWCGPCRMMAPVVDEFAAENPDIKVGKVNVDDHPQLAGAFGIESIPTLVAIRDGKTSSEFITKQSYVDKLDSIDVFAENVQDEFAILDRAGRLQIPRELLDAIGVKGNKVSLRQENGTIVIEAAERE